VSSSFPNFIRTGLSPPTYHGIFHAISTCRDGLKPRNFPAVTSPFHGPRPRLPETSPLHPRETCHGDVSGSRRNRTWVFGRLGLIVQHLGFSCQHRLKAKELTV